VPVGSIGWLADSSEGALRAALATAAPELAGLPIRINPRYTQSNPLYWSATAIIDETFVVKYAWSEVRATRVWREGELLLRLRQRDVSPAVPDVVALSREPALLVTRLVAGEPLSWEWASGLSDPDTEAVADHVARFLSSLHATDATEVLAALPEVQPSAQADTERLRNGYPRLVDERRAAMVLGWCDWVDEVMHEPRPGGEVLVHGDFHGYNQVWGRAAPALRAVVDFEESGLADPHFDLRYLPGNARGPHLLLNVIDAYASRAGTKLDVSRTMAWNVLTHLGDALWRTEAQVPLPGGGTAASWVDDLETRLAAHRLT
jgi:aminoglycoside phosphotransferase (APT) family kinase protein